MRSALVFLIGFAIAVLMAIGVTAGNLVGIHLVAAPMESLTQLEEQEKIKLEQQKACTSQLQVLGYPVEVSVNSISTKRQIDRDVEGALEQVSVAIMGCAGYNLQAFCVGDKCVDESATGIRLVLTRAMIK